MTRNRRRFLSELALALALAGCAGGPALPPPPAPRVPAFEPAVLDDASIDALAAILRMEDRRERDPRVDGWVAHPNRVVRAHAMLALGRIGADGAVPALLSGLQDQATTVRADAAFALGLVGDSSAAVITALATHLSPTADEDSRVGIEAASALGRIGSAQTWGILVERVTILDAAGAATDLDGPGREALLHLWRAPRTPTVIDAITGHLTAGDPETRWNAAYALARPGGSVAVAPLLGVAGDSSHAVRALAMRALRMGAADSAGMTDSALVVLRRGLDDGHPHVRISALGALGTWAGAAADAMVVRLFDDDDNVRIAAAQALGATGDRSAQDPLAQLAARESEPLGVRAAALTALTRIDPASAVAVCADWAAAPDWLQRLHAARTLAALGGPEAAALLLDRARDPDPRVAAAALRALPAGTPGATVVLLERLASGDPWVRAAAVRGLARDGRADLSFLLDAYDRARQDSVPVAAVAVIDALADLEQAGMPVGRSFFLRFPASPSEPVRRRAAERLGDEGWGPAPPAPGPVDRPDAFYGAVVRTLVVPAVTTGTHPRVALGTDHGEIMLVLAPEHAPLTVLNFLTLIRNGYYSSDDYGGSPALRWHRVVPNFVLQDGDPRGDGAAGPGYAIRDELNRLRYGRGVLGMALSGPDTGGAQYFITHSPQPHLDAGYTVFGRVVAGMEAADLVVQDEPIRYIREVR